MLGILMWPIKKTGYNNYKVIRKSAMKVSEKGG